MLAAPLGTSTGLALVLSLQYMKLAGVFSSLARCFALARSYGKRRLIFRLAKAPAQLRGREAPCKKYYAERIWRIPGHRPVAKMGPAASLGAQNGFAWGTLLPHSRVQSLSRLPSGATVAALLSEFLTRAGAKPLAALLETFPHHISPSMLYHPRPYAEAARI